MNVPKLKEFIRKVLFGLSGIYVFALKVDVEVS